MNKSNPKGVYSLPRAWLGTQAASGYPALGASVPACPRRRGRQEEPGTGGGKEGVGDGQEKQQPNFSLYRARVPELEVKLRPSSLPPPGDRAPGTRSLLASPSHPSPGKGRKHEAGEGRGEALTNQLRGRRGGAGSQSA